MADGAKGSGEFKYHRPGSKMGFRNMMFLVGAMLFFATAMDLIGPLQSFLMFFVAAAVCGIMVANNPDSGMHIDGRKLTIYSGKWRRSFERKKVDHFRFVDWATGPGFEVHVKEGEHFSIPQKCYPSAEQLIKYLDEQKIEVVRTAYDKVSDPDEGSDSE